MCQEIIFDKEEALQCDGECKQWYHCICVGMSCAQYEIFRDDYDRHPAKTILLIKDSSLMQAAHKILKDDGIKISDQGERLLGSVIGTESFREKYIKNKVERWVKDVQSLSKYAQDDPQAAYLAFSKGLSSM